MKYHHQNGFLLAVQDDEDIKKIDLAIEQGNLRFDKIGSRTYLAFVEDSYQWFHGQIKERFGVSGEIVWIPLQQGFVIS